VLLGFKRQFAPFVEEGSKTHTIRGKRAIAPKVGEVCHCYVDPRQKTMRLLGRWPCVRVEEIRIEPLTDNVDGCEVVYNLRVFIDGDELTPDEAESLFQRDGFKPTAPYTATAMARDFWRQRLPFEGQMIHWDYSKPVAAVSKKKRTQK
jgi:hypothetical protein